MGARRRSIKPTVLTSQTFAIQNLTRSVFRTQNGLSFLVYALTLDAFQFQMLDPTVAISVLATVPTTTFLVVLERALLRSALRFLSMNSLETSLLSVKSLLGNVRKAATVPFLLTLKHDSSARVVVRING